MSLCMHTRVRICVYVQPGHGVERVWVCVSVDRKVLQRHPGGWRVRAIPRTGQPGQSIPRPSVWSLTSGQGVLPCGAALRSRTAPSAPGFRAHRPRGKHSSGEAAFSSKASVLRRKSRLRASPTAPFVLSGV